jgi:hypothetical protein
LSLAHVDDHAAHVKPTLGANTVGGNYGAALAANLQLLGLLGMVRTTLARAGIRMSSLRYCHGFDSNKRKSKNAEDKWYLDG